VYRVLKTSSTSEVGSMEGRISMLGSVTERPGLSPPSSSPGGPDGPAKLEVATTAAPTPGRTELGLILPLAATLNRARVLVLRMTEREAAEDERRDLRASIPDVVGERWGSESSATSGGVPV
jgi:hypothetical protein